MMKQEGITFQQASQRRLSSALSETRERLERLSGSSAPPAAPRAPPAPPEAFEESQERGTLDILCESFGLSSFERSVLLLCAGIELDGCFRELCARVHGDPLSSYPTFGLALSAFDDAHWSALAPAAPLRYFRLIEVKPGDSLVSSPLRIDERVLHFLAGAPAYPDDRLDGLLDPMGSGGELLRSHAELAARIRGYLMNGASDDFLVQLTGPSTQAKRAILAAVCDDLGLALYRLKVHQIPRADAERENFARLWERETILSRAALNFDCDDLEGSEERRAVEWLLGRVHGFVFVTAREPLVIERRSSMRLEVQRPSAAERQSLWRGVLGPLAGELNGEVEAVAMQFHVDAAAIRSAGSEVVGSIVAGGNGDLGRRLWNACRTQARVRLDDLAVRIESSAGWDDLVLPSAEGAILREIAAHLRFRVKVYDEWGFARKNHTGLGIAALFAGPSGTGKTLAAEVLANELRLDLYRIDLSAVVSKYIGETEKNLRRVFDAAEESGAILLFDEADALFGKRTEIKDSHDRYANIEVGYLLQRIDTYRGLAILTTNRKDDLDSAFLRRIRFIVQFPFPDARQRAEIWRRAFPAQAPTEALDPDKLARLNVSGGHIRNIALSAAFLAADAGEPVRMQHLLRAARSEYAKLERSLTDAEVSGWI